MAAQPNSNIKQQFIVAVRAYMKASHGPGLASIYFSVGNVEPFLSTVDNYLIGVAVDAPYLANFKWGQYTGWKPSQESGLCQPKSNWWTSTVTPQEKRYNGWIILQLPPQDGETRKTAFHEAIHAYHLAIGSEDDDDANGGPELISNNFYEIVCQLNRLDVTLRDIIKSMEAGQDETERIRKLHVALDRLRASMADWSPQFHKCLANIGGKADWDGYMQAIDSLLQTVEKQKAEGGPYTLRQVDVDRSYPHQGPGNYKPGHVTFTGNVSGVSFGVGWKGSFESGLVDDDLGRINHAGKAQAAAIVHLQIPDTVAPGTTPPFSATMSGAWDNRGYGIQRDHTITLSGAAGTKSQSVGGGNNKINGPYSTQLSSSQYVQVPTDAASRELVYVIDAEIRFGGDNWGRMRLTLHYRR